MLPFLVPQLEMDVSQGAGDPIQIRGDLVLLFITKIGHQIRMHTKMSIAKLERCFHSQSAASLQPLKGPPQEVDQT